MPMGPCLPRWAEPGAFMRGTGPGAELDIRSGIADGAQSAATAPCTPGAATSGMAAIGPTGAELGKRSRRVFFLKNTMLIPS